jgi:predicted O-methyltransferase YrrM
MLNTRANVPKRLLGYYSKKAIIKRARIPGEIIHSDKESEVIWDLANKAIKPGGLALEIGTWKGNSAYIIVSICAQRNAHLVCVDSFNGDMLYGGNATSLDFLRDNALNHLNGLPVSFIVMDSVEAPKILADHAFDFVFIDGDHTEPVVSQDIKNYYKKVKKGGIYSGHDYDYVFADPKVQFNVKANVDKICGKVSVIDTIWYKRI